MSEVRVDLEASNEFMPFNKDVFAQIHLNYFPSNRVLIVFPFVFLNYYNFGFKFQKCVFSI